MSRHGRGPLRCGRRMKAQKRHKPGRRRSVHPRGCSISRWGSEPGSLPPPGALPPPHHVRLHFSRTLGTVGPSQDSTDYFQVLSRDLQRAPLAPWLPDSPQPKRLRQSERAGQHCNPGVGSSHQGCPERGSTFIFSTPL